MLVLLPFPFFEHEAFITTSIHDMYLDGIITFLEFVRHSILHFTKNEMREFHNIPPHLGQCYFYFIVNAFPQNLSHLLCMKISNVVHIRIVLARFINKVLYF